MHAPKKAHVMINKSTFTLCLLLSHFFVDMTIHIFVQVENSIYWTWFFTWNIYSFLPVNVFVNISWHYIQYVLIDCITYRLRDLSWFYFSCTPTLYNLFYMLLSHYNRSWKICQCMEILATSVQVTTSVLQVIWVLEVIYSMPLDLG